MSGEDRQSQLAQEHKERQAQRAEQATKTKRNTFIGAGAAVVVVAGGVIAAATLLGGNSEGTPAAQSSPAPSETTAQSMPSIAPTAPADASAVSCSYRKDTSGSPAKKVGMPPSKPNLKLKTMTIATSQGDIVIDLATAQAPCSVNSLAFLAKKNFYDKTKCHRLATPENSGLAMLQCGDPLAKADGKNPTDGQGSSGYVFNDENLGGIPFTKGTVALAQPPEAANQNGSQFWISLGDETAQLGPDYTPFGVVSKGMDVLDKVYKGGWITNPDDITGDGGSSAPKIPVVIKDVTLS
ncbi:peptidyl-prolyl cis-trans isomerase B (cyclophilin B) [Streptosporangium album]|uniref:Peptidyl-prolyl cis-trans isomerase B (Cyclophilin B) n=1 Tax=Streptosporangium album TaxID=47479 RepID=A0A7W7S228_9ACTN|nr:peptidylprolyl isomerase [Streptosporangium album]MBB4942335.1 peptidyl-prolyl cis-trans isomerase B (cyclophilin B) [Streptosporangium album]